MDLKVDAAITDEKQRGGVALCLDSLAARVHDLEEAAETLTGRLLWVLGPEVPVAEDPTSREKDTERCELVELLNKVRYRIETVNRRLHNCLDRCEL